MKLKSHWDVAITGGGIGGVMAAHRLLKNRLSPPNITAGFTRSLSQVAANGLYGADRITTGK